MKSIAESEKVIKEKEKPHFNAVELKQMIWGQGEIGPANVNFVKSMIKPFGLKPSSMMLDLSAGLGSLIRHVVDEYGAWTEGYDTDKEIVEEAAHLSKKLGYSRQAPLKFVDYDLLELKKKYDSVFMQEKLNTIMNLGEFLDKIETAMTAQGQMLLIDHFLDKEKCDKVAIEDWRKTQPEYINIYTLEEVLSELKQRNLDARVIQDITKDIMTLSKSALTRILARLKSGDFQKAEKMMIFKEVNKIVRKIQAWQNGLHAYKIFIIKG